MTDKENRDSKDDEFPWMYSHPPFPRLEHSRA